MNGRITKLGGIAGLSVMLASSQAFAVFSTETGGAAAPQVTVALDLTLESAITLTLTAISGTTFSTANDSTVGSASATVNFGNVNTTCTYNISVGKCIRVTAAPTGAFFVASFEAQVDVAGLNPAQADIGINYATAPDNGRLYKWSLCPGNACTSTTTSDTSWPGNAAAASSGADIAAAPADEIANNLASGGGANVVRHQLAIFVPDTYSTLGPMTDVDIVYTAVADNVD